MSRKLVVVGCATLIVLALGTLAYFHVFSFRWADIFNPHVVGAMWSWVDRVRVPRIGWLVSACLVAMTAQILALVVAKRRHRHWRALQQVAVRGEGVQPEPLSGLRLHIGLSAAWLLIPCGAVFSVATARELVIRAFDLDHGALRDLSVWDLLNGQLVALGVATLVALLAAVVGGLAWSRELSMRLQTRGLAAARIARSDAPAASVQAASPGPSLVQTATLIYMWIGLGALPFAVGVWTFLWRLYAGQASLPYIEGSRTAAMSEVLTRARHTLQTAAWVQLVGTVLAIIVTARLLARWRRRWPTVVVTGPSTWGRTLLWSSLCLAAAMVCLKLAGPLRAENKMGWPPQRLLINCGYTTKEGLEGPDTLNRAPLLQVRSDGLFVNGKLGDTLETVDNLITERNNFKLLHPNESFQGRVLLDCHNDQPAQRLQQALSAVARAGYQEVQFCVTTGETLRRPTLGPITRWKTTAARARIGDGATTLPPQTIRTWPDTTCNQMRRRIVEFRHAGLEVVLAAPEKTEAERQAAAILAKAAAAKQEIASKAAKNAKPPTCAANQVEIPSGTFAMGSAAGAPDEKPVHQVTLSPYCIDKTEVTVAAYRTCVQAGACKEPSTAALPCTWLSAGKDQHTMTCLDWNEAKAFCQWAGSRLPTEAEWEYAARGRDGRKYPWGNPWPTPSRLNLCGKQGDWEYTAPVGSYPEGASPFGVLDMAGNVWEWTDDDYDDYGPDPVTNPRGSLPDATRRVIRGGGWSYAVPYQVGATMREKYYDAHSEYDLGFRCARGPIHFPAFP